jgi:hypothetical protein
VTKRQKKERKEKQISFNFCFANDFLTYVTNKWKKRKQTKRRKVEIYISIFA